MRASYRGGAALLAGALLAAGLSGCGSSTSAASGPDAAASSAPAVRYGSGSAGPIGLSDGWISDAGMSGMTGMSGTSGRGSGGQLAAYGVIHDRGAIGDRLVSVASPAARRTDLHTTVDHGSAETMRQVTGLDLPAGGEIRFQIGGSHVMLSGLRQPVRAGMRIPLVFTFASGSVLHASFPVLDPEDRPGL